MFCKQKLNLCRIKGILNFAFTTHPYYLCACVNVTDKGNVNVTKLRLYISYHTLKNKKYEK